MADCNKLNCKKDCCGKPNYADHCMRGMFCVHCGKAFCTVDPGELRRLEKDERG